MELEKKLSIEVIQDSKNLCDKFTEEELRKVGAEVVQSYKIDKQSRKGWEEKMEDATKLALQLVEEKTSPWEGAANVKFPLLTIAALQFQSRAYPSLIKAPDLVKYRVQGKDDGAKSARAHRVSRHMSYQLLEQDESWEEDQDKAFLAIPILGCVFKKSYYDVVKGHNLSRLVLPKNLVVHYYAKSIEDCERKTEVFELYARQIRERELHGIFKEHEYGPAEEKGDNKEVDKRQGLTPPLSDKNRPRTFLEQHCYFDFDGDGYKEPYVVTVDEATMKVARIVHRIKTITTEQALKIKDIQARMKALGEGIQQPQDPNNPSPQEVAQIQQIEQVLLGMQEEVKVLSEQKPKILSIEPVEYYTKYPFIPSPDG